MVVSQRLNPTGQRWGEYSTRLLDPQKLQSQAETVVRTVLGSQTCRDASRGQRVLWLLSSCQSFSLHQCLHTLPLYLFPGIILFSTVGWKHLLASICMKSSNWSVIYRAAGLGTNQSRTGKFKQQNTGSWINEIGNHATVEMRCDDEVIVIAPQLSVFHISYFFSSICRFFIHTNESHEPCVAFIMMAHCEQIKNLNLKRKG